MRVHLTHPWSWLAPAGWREDGVTRWLVLWLLALLAVLALPPLLGY